MVSLFLRSVRRLPYRIVESLLVIASVCEYALRPRRLRRVVRWAKAYETSWPRRCRLVLALLANRGRFVAVSGITALMAPEAFRRRVRLEGAALLDDANGSPGKILLAFHVGPAAGPWALRLAGHNYVAAMTGVAALRWPPSRPGWPAVPDPTLWDDAAVSRSVALDRLRRLVLDGTAVGLAADGGSGRELFRIVVPRGEIVIRAGWWMLRRLTGVPVFPILAHRDRSGMVVVVHPPLPPPAPDPDEDARVCEAVLAPLLRRYVHTFPEQCVAMALSAA